MKPVYEIVRAEELRAGDVVLDLRGGAVEPYVIDLELVEIAHKAPKDLYPPKVRQLPPERNPEVLGLVIKKLHNACGILADTANCNGSLKDIDTLIRNAIRELESEAGK